MKVERKPGLWLRQFEHSRGHLHTTQKNNDCINPIQLKPGGELR